MSIPYEEKDVTSPLLPTSTSEEAGKKSKRGKKPKKSVWQILKKDSLRIVGKVFVLCILAAVFDIARVAVTRKAQVRAIPSLKDTHIWIDL
jgi:hypothetical protein